METPQSVPEKKREIFLILSLFFLLLSLFSLPVSTGPAIFFEIAAVLT